MNSNFEWLEVQAPAKLNFTFEVLRRRPDGFHEIRSLVTPIAIFDTISARIAPTLTFKVVIPSEEKYQRLFSGKIIPTDDTNLVIRATKLLQRYLPLRLQNANLQPNLTNPDLLGAEIILQKRIPSEAGMGGGSSDAAATMILLNELWNLHFSREELAKIGAEIGSDVPLFIGDFPVICRGRGEILEPVQNGECFPKLYLVVVKPNSGCSTPEVYRRCTPCDKVDEREMNQMIEHWKENRLEAVGAGLRNQLTEPATTISPEVKYLLGMFKEMPEPCLGVTMTGSGSACFGLCRNRVHAVNVANYFEHHYFGTVFVAETLSSPLRVERRVP